MARINDDAAYPVVPAVEGQKALVVDVDGATRKVESFFPADGSVSYASFGPTAIEYIDNVFYGLVGIPPVTISAANYTLTEADLGGSLRFTAGCTVLLPATLPAGYNVNLRQVGSSSVTWSAGSGATVHVPTAGTAIAGQWSTVVAVVDQNTDGSSAVWIIEGSTN